MSASAAARKRASRTGATGTGSDLGQHEPGGVTGRGIDSDPKGPREVLRAPACALGADPSIVTRRVVTDNSNHVFMAGTAIRYREEPAPGAASP